ncbi:MAG TPA: ABC transporter permease [Mucilaginibacter sp.]|nr:ABC transporter permease [Mucilaginibacter sp.]
MLKNYFKVALRSFKRHKLFTLINIIGLSIGISAALVIYLIVHYDFTFDKFHKDGDRIYRVVTNYSFSGEPGFNGGVNGPMTLAVKSDVTGIEASAPFFTLYQFTALIPNGTKTPVKFRNEENSILADQRYFDMFKYNWLAGSAKTSLNAPNQLVLTSEQAKVYFPKLSYQQMLGKQVVFEDTIHTTVTGIVETIKENTDFKFKDFVSYSTINSVRALKDQAQLTEWGSTTSASLLFVKLSSKTSVASIEKQLNAIFKKNNPPKPEDKGSSEDFHLQPLNDIHFNEKYGNFDIGHIANKTTLIGLLVIAAFLLLLGCINFINLTTAQASQRAKEIGIRKTLGSMRSQLIAQFLSETFLITLTAVVISVALVPSVLKLFSDFISKDITLNLLGQPGLIVFIVLLTLVVSLLSGFYPALILSSYKPALVLKNQAQSGSSKTRNAWLRKTLTVTQFIIAQFFIMATLLVSKQIYYALHKDLGFKKEAILSIQTPWKNNTNSKKQVFMNQLRAIPQVELVSAGGAPPSSGNTQSTTVSYKDGKKEVKTDLQLKYADENYISVYKIKILAGHDLLLSDTARQMVINTTYAKVLGFKDPHQAIGKFIDWDKKKAEIIGVVQDFYQKSLREPIKPLAIMQHGDRQYHNGNFHIALKPQTTGGQEWKKAIASMEQAWKQEYPEDSFEYNFYDESIAKFYENEQHTSKLLTWATGLSIFISCLGLLGLAMYTTNLRTKEIGVRKVLGASVANIVRLLSTELVLLVLFAFVIVTPVAWWSMNKWMQNFADRTPISWWIFVLSGAGMLLTALITLSVQTVKAAIANPVKSLRSE